MAKRDEWYANRRWDAAARAEFDKRIRRARAGLSRAWYFKVRARYLWLDDEGRQRPHLTLELLERALVEAGGDGEAAAELHYELAVFQLAASDRAAGTASLRRCLDAARSNPRGPPHGAQRLLARCLIDAGDYPAAIRLFDEIYADRDPPISYAALESREALASDGKPHPSPDAAAECVVAYHHAGDTGWPGQADEPPVPDVARSDRAAIAALDRHFAIADPKFREPLRRPFQPWTAYSLEWIEQHFVPEYGAFLGRVLVNTAGGKWIARKPLMTSRIRLGRREVDPFRAAFATAFYEVPLAVALEQIESETASFALP